MEGEQRKNVQARRTEEEPALTARDLLDMDRRLVDIEGKPENPQVPMLYCV